MRVLEMSGDLDRGDVPRTLGTLAFPEREKLSQRAYDHISSRLSDGSMQPGEKLFLRPLAARLDLSVTPVREALVRLVAERALALDDRGSAVVPVMAAEQIHEMCAVRSDLEARAAERAAEVVRRSDLDRLQPICNASVSALGHGSYQDILTANACFHRMICQIGRSSLIQSVLERLWSQLGPLYAVGLAETVTSFAPGTHPHEMMMVALQAGDVASAREAALQDVQAGERLINRRFLQGLGC